MKIDIDTLRDTVKISFDIFRDSREESEKVQDFYHNRQYSPEEKAIIQEKQQAEETFNIIKRYARLLLGYYSTVVNTIQVVPRQPEDKATALLLHDLSQYTLEYNEFETEGDKIKLDGLLSGLMCCYINVVDSGKRDTFGRVIYRIELSHVPSREILIDPMSFKEDYSDARYIHRFKWVSKELLEKIIRSVGKQVKPIMDHLEAYGNNVNEEDIAFTKYYKQQFTGYNKDYDCYLLFHSIIMDDKDRTWSLLWVDDTIIDKKEVTYKEVRFPYRLQKLHPSNKAEYYGLFREIIETQRAINQALIKIQTALNTSKAIIQEGSVEDVDAFTKQFNNISGVTVVKQLQGVRIQDTRKEVLDQYTIIDKAIDRAQQLIGINPSFLGQAHASDSGRKVKLQQDSTMLVLRYVTTKIEQFYRLMGKDIVNLIKQYYTASEVLRIVDPVVGEKWIEINKPITLWTGRMDEETGMPEMYTPLDLAIDPETNKPIINEAGEYIAAPIPQEETEIAFSDIDISIDTIAYNQQQENTQVLFDTVLNGNLGAALQQVNLAGYFEIAKLSAQTINTPKSLQIAEYLQQTADIVRQQQEMQQQGQVQQQEQTQQQSVSPEQVQAQQNV